MKEDFLPHYRGQESDVTSLITEKSLHFSIVVILIVSKPQSASHSVNFFTPGIEALDVMAQANVIRVQSSRCPYRMCVVVELHSQRVGILYQKNVKLQVRSRVKTLPLRACR